MADFGLFPSKDNSAAVEDLLSQAKDAYVLEQVAAINCSAFTDVSSLPTNLETRFRRLKSLPVSRPGSDPVSSSKKLLSHSKTMASSRSAFPGDENKIFSGKSDSGKIGSSSSRFSRESKIFPGIKRNLSVNSGFGLETLKLLPKEKSRISSSSFTSIDLSSPTSSNQEPEKSKPKSKSRFSSSWFGKLTSPAQAMGCLWRSPSKSCNSEESAAEESMRKLKIAKKEAKRRDKKVDRLIRKSRRALKGYF